jgi:outer membrane protein assembly factor BamD (BamD/ComL family)
MKLTRVCVLLMTILLLEGCVFAAAPIVALGGAGHAAFRLEENKKFKKAAILNEEHDLLTFSIQSILNNNTDHAIDTYLKSYNTDSYTKNMKVLSLYQIALIYMNRFNEDLNYQQAINYFETIQKEFPNSLLNESITHRLVLIKKRLNNTQQPTSEELLKTLNRAELLAQSNIPFDAELRPLSERAIIYNRSKDVEKTYLILYNNTASTDEIRASAIYQIALVYMSKYNSQADYKKSFKYFKMIINEFPNSPLAKKSQRNLAKVLNQR